MMLMNLFNIVLNSKINPIPIPPNINTFILILFRISIVENITEVSRVLSEPEKWTAKNVRYAANKGEVVEI